MVVRDDVVLRDDDAAAAGIFDFLLRLVSVPAAPAVSVAVAVPVAIAVSEVVPEDVPGVHPAAAVAVAVSVAVSAAVAVHNLVVIDADHAVPNLGNRLGEGGSQHDRFRRVRPLGRPQRGAGQHAYHRQRDISEYPLAENLSHPAQTSFRFSRSL